MTNLMASFMQDKAQQVEYRAWRDRPDTQRYLEMVGETSRPAMPATADVVVLAMSHAVQCGVFTALDRLTHLDEFELVAEDLVPDYGSSEFVKRWGRRQLGAK